MHMKKKLYKAANKNRQSCLQTNIMLWPDRILFFGPLQRLSLHSISSLCINVGIYQPFLAGTEKGVQTPYRACVIPAGCRHNLSANGNLIASLVIENTATGFFSTGNRLSHNPTSITQLPGIEWTKCFRYIYEERPSREIITQLINSLPGIEESSVSTLDPRIQAALDAINLSPSDNHGLEILASSVGLSASRFRHLFQEQTNIPLRRYKQWRRVVSAMRSLNNVDNLTHAAMRSGFTDSSHFSRCFRDTFGVSPSLVFKNLDRFEVY